MGALTSSVASLLEQPENIIIKQNHFDSMANIKANINKLTEEIADWSAEYSSIIC